MLPSDWQKAAHCYERDEDNLNLKQQLPFTCITCEDFGNVDYVIR